MTTTPATGTAKSPPQRSRAVPDRASAQGRVRWELLQALVRKDLKVKYKNSTIGFAWSLANPLLLLAVYYLVFGVFFRNTTPHFVVYLMAGILVWNFFGNAVMTAAGSVVGNANLVKKVRFAQLVLPLSAVGYALVHFLLQMGVFLLVLLATDRHFLGPQLVLLIPGLAVALLFTSALCILVSALNVRYRDVQHLLEVGLQAWFWLNPVIYTAGLIRSHTTSGALYRTYFVVNPMSGIIATVQRAIYRDVKVPQPAGACASSQIGTKPVSCSDWVLAAPGYAWYLENLAVIGAASGLLLWLAMTTFRRLSADFAEDL